MIYLFGETWFVSGTKQRMRWKTSGQPLLPASDVSFVFLRAKTLQARRLKRGIKKQPLLSCSCTPAGGCLEMARKQLKEMSKYFYCFLKIFIRVDLQCSVNFCLAKWPSYTYTHSFSHIILHHVPSQVIGYSSLC